MHCLKIVFGVFLSAVPATAIWAQNFTTAAEVRPILQATQGNWLAVREYDGQDLLYFTHLESWRCGLSEVQYSVNGGDLQTWEMEPCYEGEPAPNAIKAEGRLPYTVFELQSVDSVAVTLFYDDGETASAEFARASILMP